MTTRIDLFAPGLKFASGPEPEGEEPSREIQAKILPWDAITVDERRFAFSKGSVELPENPGRVKMFTNHEASVENLVGVAVSFEEKDDGLYGTFRLANTPLADHALGLIREGILDGVSVGVGPVDTKNGMGYSYDEENDTVTFTSGVALFEVSLVGLPAFADARTFGAKITNFNIPEKKEITQMTDTNANAINDLVEGFTTAITDLTSTLREEFAPVEPVVTMAPATANPRPVYGLGSPHSLVADAWAASGLSSEALTRNPEGPARYRQFEAALSAGEFTPVSRKFANGDVRFSFERFADQSTTVHPSLVPEQPTPSMYQDLLLNPKPLAQLVTVGTIRNAQSFSFPKFTGYSGLWGAASEGVDPTDGALTTTDQSVEPGEVSGSITLTRRVLDTATPDLDQVALGAFADARAEYLEARIVTVLNAITAANTGPGAVLAITGDGIDLLDGLSDELVDAAMRPGGFRFTGGAVSPAVLKVLRKLRDTNGTPLLPRGGSDIGSVDTRTASVVLEDLVRLYATGRLSTNNYLLNKSDVRVWVSPVTGFRFEKTSTIQLAAHGYMAAASLRDAAVTRFTYTAA